MLDIFIPSVVMLNAILLSIPTKVFLSGMKTVQLANNILKYVEKMTLVSTDWISAIT